MASTKHSDVHDNEKIPLKVDVFKTVYGADLFDVEDKQDIYDSLRKCDGAEEPARDSREKWDSKVQFLLSVIAYAVGLGNVWRFPYLCQKNGGGAFLIPYFIMLVVEGIPLCVLELGIGQRLKLGSISVWNRIHPFLGGLGICSAIVAFLVGLYYNAIIAWCFFYLFNSFQSPLPWTDCPVDAQTNGTTVVHECTVSSPTSFFWFRETLDISSGIDDFGGMQWALAGCLALAWLLVFIFMSKGIQSSGKVMYFTACFPYVVLIVFFGRALTLKGASDGLAHLFTPQMEKLKDPTVWLDAATQIFYSLGLGFGSLIAFGSYNPSDNNVTLDAVVVSLTNAFTAIFASLVIFVVLGFKATLGYENCACRFIQEHHSLYRMSLDQALSLSEDPTKCLELYDLAMRDEFSRLAALANGTCSLAKQLNEETEGTGLAFIVFTQAINQLPAAPFWSMMFFLMLLALGLGSIFGNFAGIQTSIYDLKLCNWMSKRTLSAIMCSVSFVVGLLFMTKSGIYWIELFDSFSATFSLMLVAFLEMVGVCWIFGYKRFSDDLEMMTGRRLSHYWEITLKYLAPLLILTVWLSSVVIRILNGLEYHPYDAETGKSYAAPYPDWAKAISLMLVTVGIAPIVGVIAVRVFGWRRLETNPRETGAALNTSASTAIFSRSSSVQLDDDPERGENDSAVGGSCVSVSTKELRTDISEH